MMLSKIHHLLSTIIRAFALAFLASSLHIFLEHRLHPQQFLPYSAPWYTGIYVNGLITLLLIACFAAARLLVRHYLKKEA